MRVYKSVPLQSLSVGEVMLQWRNLIQRKVQASMISLHGLPVIVLKTLPSLHDIINRMIATGKLPDLWKKALVSQISRVGTTAEHKHYWRVSLLYHLGKLSEQVVINKMRTAIGDAIQTQYAYEHEVSTTDVLHHYVWLSRFVITWPSAFVFYVLLYTRQFIYSSSFVWTP